MDLIVIRRDGRRETIAISPDSVVRQNDGSELWSIRCLDGVDHYFTLDGYYDGWGLNVIDHDLSIKEAEEIIKSIEGAQRLKEYN